MSDRDSAHPGRVYLAEFRVGHPDFPLMDTLEALPDISIRSQFQPGTSPAVPEKHFVVEADDFEAVETALREDPSVVNVDRIGEWDDRRSYRIRFTESTELISPSLTDEDVEVLAIDKAGDKWEFRLVAPDRSTVVEVLDSVRSDCRYFSLKRLYATVREPSTAPANLTPTQRRTVALAYREGFFKVPREISLATLGEQLGVSDSAVSERLRKALDTLIGETLPMAPEDRD